MALRLDGYVRVSRVGKREGESFISPDVQREQIENWAKLRGVTIAEWHTDLDQTGGKLSRPGLDAMMQRVRHGHTDGIVVARLDRLSRAGVADALKLVEELADHGAQLAVVDLGVDPTTVFGEFATTLMLAFARMERRRIAENWQDAQARAIARGVHTRAPFGYSKPGNGQRLEPNEHAPLVREVFERRASGASWAELARFLNAHAKPTNAEQWTHSTVTHVVHNRAYIGEAKHGQHVNPDAHPAIVGRDLFERANAISHRAPSRNGSEGSLLTGIIRCAGCRHSMSPAHTQSGRKVKQLVYRCRREHGNGRCPEPTSINRSTIEQYVEQLFLSRYGSTFAGGIDASAELQDAQQALVDAEAELDAYLQDVTARQALEAVGAEGAWRRGLEARTAALRDAKAAVEDAHARSIGFRVPDAPTWAALTIPERRTLLTAGIDAVFVRRVRPIQRPVEERVRVLWTGEADDDLPGRHRGAAAPIVPLRW